MKKFILLFAGILSSALAFADYNYVLFSLDNGEKKSIASENLKITFSSGNLIAESGETVLSLPLNDLASMEFSNDSSGDAGIESLSPDTWQDVNIFTIDGEHKGKFESLQNAANILPKGIYIVNVKNGQSFKIVVGK